MKQYAVNEIFYSIQGEGVRAGIPHAFIRLAGCNLRCAGDDPESGFDCDTEFVSSRKLTAVEIVAEVERISMGSRNVILTGGEPTLQLDGELAEAFKAQNYWLSLETNGTKEIPLKWADWITVSPKSAEHTIRQTIADEVKYVRHYGQGIPKPVVEAENYLISPAFGSDGRIDPETLAWCIDLVKQNPTWRLSVQQHKLWKIR